MVASPRIVPQKFLAARQSKVRAWLKQLNLDAILVTGELNVRYLSGFTGDSSYLLVTAGKVFLLSDSRYTIQIQEECQGIEVDIRTAKTPMLDQVAAVSNSNKVLKLAIESESMTKLFHDQLAAKLVGVELVDTDSVVLGFRAIKDQHEISTIRHSIKIAERAFEAACANLRGDQTELEIAHDLEHTIRKFGGTRCAFDPIVGIGPRAALPHGQPSKMQIHEHPFVLIDWGAQFNGYASDLTRILVTGRISAKLRRIYDIVLRAQIAAIDKIRPGAELLEIDRTARQIIENAGHAKHFGHGLGHGFGLQIHELPRMSPVSSGSLEPGMIVTVEPGIYLTEWGGVRIEDDILVTEDGHEVLTSLTKEIEACAIDCF